MKRKTNLFYLGETQDNNYLSLSNYSESLTGNLISTDNKIFPSSFLLINLKNIRSEEKAKKYCEDNNIDIDIDNLEGYEKASKIFAINKLDFIVNYLIPYYENKMATLRDWCISNNINQETYLLPLNYLLHIIYKYEGIEEVEGSDCPIVGYDNITEQDYNGTFTDTICVVDPSTIKSAKPIYNSTDYTKKVAELESESQKYLHGWSAKTENYAEELDFNKDNKITLSLYPSDDNEFLKNAGDDWKALRSQYNFVSNDLSDDYNTYIRLCTAAGVEIDKTILDAIIEHAKFTEIWHGPSDYEGIEPIYDSYKDHGIPTYEITSSIKGLELIKKTLNDENELEFNVCIPLYDVIDTNWVTDDKQIDENVTTIDLSDGSSSEQMIQNVPLGIWFSGPKNVKLYVDPSNGNTSTWSLSLASQFKPFPASDMMPDEITNDAKKDAYMTFAQVLVSQNEMMSKISSTMNNISYLSSRVSDLESKINSVLTSYNLDDFRKEYQELENSLGNKIAVLEDKIEALNLRWVNKEG